jgi:hypothetical protein
MLRQASILLLSVMFMAAMLYFAFPANVTQDNSSQGVEYTAENKNQDQ